MQINSQSCAVSKTDRLFVGYLPASLAFLLFSFYLLVFATAMKKHHSIRVSFPDDNRDNVNNRTTKATRGCHKMAYNNDNTQVGSARPLSVLSREMSGAKAKPVTWRA